MRHDLFLGAMSRMFPVLMPKCCAYVEEERQKSKKHLREHRPQETAS